MVDIKEVFGNKIPNYDIMLKYGFKETEKCYYYIKPFSVSGNQFKIIVKVYKETNQVISGVIDAEMGVSYDLINCPSAQGEVVNTTREVYDKTLESVSKLCFDLEDDIKEKDTKDTLLPGHLGDGRVVLFSSQLEALEAEAKRLTCIEVNDGGLSEIEREKKAKIDEILVNPVVSKDPINSEEVGYGTEFSSALTDNPERKFIMVYGLLPAVSKSVDGAMFLTRETPFGEAVFGKKVEETFSFQNRNGIELNGVVTQIHSENNEYVGDKVANHSSHGVKRLGKRSC